MVSADGSSQSFSRLTAQIACLGLRVGGHPALCLHSSNELGELSLWLCRDGSTVNIVSNIIILLLLYYSSAVWCCRLLWISSKWLKTRWQLRVLRWQTVQLPQPRTSHLEHLVYHWMWNSKLRSSSFHRTRSPTMLLWWTLVSWTCPMPFSWPTVDRRVPTACHRCLTSWKLNCTNWCCRGRISLHLFRALISSYKIIS